MKKVIGADKISPPTSVGIEIFKTVASRLLGAHSCVHRNLRSLGSGYRAVDKRLELVDKKMQDAINNGFKDVSIWLDPAQRDICWDSVQSLFIYGSFGSGKTEVAKLKARQFLERKYKDCGKAVLILSACSEYGDCDKLLDKFKTLFSAWENANIKIIVANRKQNGCEIFAIQQYI